MLDVPTPPWSELGRELTVYRREIFDDWMAAKRAVMDLSASTLTEETLADQSAALLDALIDLLESGTIDDESTAPFKAVERRLKEIALTRAAAHLPGSAMGQSLFTLKTALMKHRSERGTVDFSDIFPLIDRLVAGAFDAYANAVQTMLQAIIETAADGIITMDETGHVRSFNVAAEKIFGYASEEVVGHNIKMLMPSPYREEHDGYLEAYRRTGVSNVLGARRELQGCRKDGTNFPIELNARAVTAGGSRLFSGIVRDLTEIKAAQDALRRRDQDIHELSTPIISVWNGVLALPLIGTMDSRRTQDAMEKALTALSETRAQALIIDITGVSVIDTMVADHLIRLATAAGMMGAKCILTGINPATAMAIVGLGLDLSSLATRSTLAEGLRLAISIVDVSAVGEAA